MLGKIITIVTVLVTIGILTQACEVDEMRNGYRIAEAKCGFGFGCKSEYRYDTNEACRLALKGRKYDICSHKMPCKNEGSCLQISQDPGFKCRCEGTGYYGTQCERPCPGPNNVRSRGPFPYECVVI